MVAGQKSVGSNGLQNLLFPLPYMYISQGENGGYSHQGTFNMDFLGWGPNGRIYQAPYYAPCDLICYRVRQNEGAIWNSLDEVNFIDGTTDFCCINVHHDNNLMSIAEGTIVRQGDLLGHTGTFPPNQVTGDHVHLGVVKGHWRSGYSNSYGVWTLNGQYNIYNAMGVDGTVLYRPESYNWKEWGETPPPPPPTRKLDFQPILISGCLNFYRK